MCIAYFFIVLDVFKINSNKINLLTCNMRIGLVACPEPEARVLNFQAFWIVLEFKSVAFLCVQQNLYLRFTSVIALNTIVIPF